MQAEVTVSKRRFPSEGTMSWTSTLVVVCTMLLFSYAHGGSSDVVMLDADNFGSMTKDGIWFVNFFAPWCGHCKRVAPVWETVATQLKDVGIRVGKIDADGEQEIAEQYAIRAYPTFKIIDGGKVTDFKGKLLQEEFLKFAREYKDKQGKTGGGAAQSQGGKSSDGDALSTFRGWAWRLASDSLGLYSVVVFGTGFFVGVLCGVLVAVREKDKIQ